jgi:tripartite-type tricarboxylate transporter receptor subunit TctC
MRIPAQKKGTMRYDLISRALRAALPIAALVVALPAAAQDFPTHPLRVIVPQPPGGGFDLVGRVMADKMAQLLGEPVTVENRPGSGTLVGTDAAAKANPDGYTMVVGGLPNIGFNPGLYKNLPYDSLRDFVPVGLAVTYGYTIVSRKDLPQNTLAEVLAYARANPGKLTFGSGGNGTGQHIGMAVLAHLAHVSMVHVPYKGSQAAYQDLLGGRIDLFLDNTSTARHFIDSKQVKAFAVTNAKPDPTMPGLPTVRQAKGPDYELESWFGYFTQAKVPPKVLTRLRAAFAQALTAPEVVTRFENSGGRVLHLSPADTEALVKHDVEHWTRLVKDAGIHVDN